MDSETRLFEGDDGRQPLVHGKCLAPVTVSIFFYEMSRDLLLDQIYGVCWVKVGLF